MERLRWLRWLVVLGVTALTLGAILLVRDGFAVEASSDSLVLENDPDWLFYERTAVDFGSDEFLLVALQRDDLFSPDGVSQVHELTQRMGELDGVQSVSSISNVRLLASRPTPLPLMWELNLKPLHLPDEGVDLERARLELTQHEAYVGNLISPDGSSAGIIVTLAQDERLIELNAERVMLLYESKAPLVAEPRREEITRRLGELAPEYQRLEMVRREKRIQVVRDAQSLVQEYRRGGATIHMSGVPVIVINMVDALDEDLRWFSGAALVFLVLFLGMVFRRVRWVVLPLITCLATASWVLALFVLEGKRTTVITANIPSLLVVIGMAHSIHFIIRHRELVASRPDLDGPGLIRATLRSIIEPCLYTAATTSVGFASLSIAGIRPVIDFGLHMALGSLLALVLSFTFMPAALSLLRPLGSRDGRLDGSARGLDLLVGWALGHRLGVWLLCAVVTLVSVLGLLRLEVETRFIDYFREDSSMYRDLAFVDEQMGGTTGIEVVLQSDEAEWLRKEEALSLAERIHEWMVARAEVGTVVSLIDLAHESQKLVVSGGGSRPGLAGSVKTVERFLDREVLAPYVTEDFSKLRIVGRVYEAYEDLDRAALLSALRGHLDEATAGLPVEATVTGMFVPYTNLLSSLTGSQQSATMLVAVLLFVMLAVLLRSIRAAVIGMVPSSLPIIVVLGYMGWAGVHLDMATVMIASVALGIAVDGTIHYLFRYREELRIDGQVEAAIRRSQRSSGTAILFTSLTAVAGFLVLTLSNFKPNVYFGLLTGLAMATAIFAALTVLPVLIAWARPFGKPVDAGQSVS